MKIYTYYENINFKHQDELITLWENSWRACGFEPIILTKKDAEKADFYKEFVAELTRLHKEIANKPLSKYGLSCWLRWLAYSTQVEEKFYVGDYDVINHNFKPKEPIDTLHLIDDCCPCFASGTPSQFLNLCKKIIDVTEQNKQTFIDIYKRRNFVHFHDQTFFIIHYDEQKTDKNKDGSSNVKIKLTREKNFISCPQRDNFWERPLVHYSHNACKCYCHQNNIEFNDSQRCNIIKQYINK